MQVHLSYHIGSGTSRGSVCGGLAGLLPPTRPHRDDGPQLCPLHPLQVSPVPSGGVHQKDKSQEWDFIYNELLL